MKTLVYIDGFNLYNGCVKYSLHKWLNLRKLCESMLLGHEVATIKYFTAKVSARPDDPDQPARQMIYWRALRTIPGLEIIEGTFYETERSMPMADSCHLHKMVDGRPPLVRVVRSEEKGSDVNLGAHMLWDGYKGFYEQAVVITNDSDLATPFTMVSKGLGLPVGIINPHEHHSKKLKPLATFMARIREDDLANSQFDNPIRDAKGEIRKPDKWDVPRAARRVQFCFLRGGMNRLK
jgi:hypothetical protein